MGKHSDVVYRRNKKESIIPQLIRYSLIKSILVEHMTVKEVPLPSPRPPPSGESTIPPPRKSHAAPAEATSKKFSTKNATRWPRNLPNGDL